MAWYHGMPQWVSWVSSGRWLECILPRTIKVGGFGGGKRPTLEELRKLNEPGDRFTCDVGFFGR